MNHDPSALIAQRSRTWAFASFDERVGIERIVCALEKDGAAVVSGHSLNSFESLCWDLGTLHGRAKNDRYGDLEEDLGDDDGSLVRDDGSRIDHHTDGTLRHSPKIVGMYCVTSAIAGGESQVVDGKDLYEALRQRGNGILDYAKTIPLMRDIDGNLMRVFSESEGRIITRFDPKIRDTVFSDAVWEEIATIQKEKVLMGGEGLLIDNTRMIHGRGGYVPPRKMVRVWIDPKEEFAQRIGNGFVHSRY